jgi:hypothetical protein
MIGADAAQDHGAREAAKRSNADQLRSGGADRTEI